MDRKRRSLALALASVLVTSGCGEWDAIVSSQTSQPSPTTEDQGPSSSEGDAPGTVPPQYSGPAAWSLENDATAITLVEGAAVSDVTKVFADAASPSFASLGEVIAWVDGDAYHRDWVAAGRMQEWVFVWENNGFRGSEATALARLSKSGTAASFYWNVNEDMQFALAQDGQVVRSFDPYDVAAGGNGVGRPLPLEDDADWTQPTPAGLILLSQVTQTPVADPAWLKRPGVLFLGLTREA